MLKMIAGASVLVVAVMMIRRLTKGRISMRLRYALWIMVALRLVVPGSIGSSPLSVMSLRKMAEPYIEKTVQHMHKESADVAGNAGRAEFAGIAGNAEGKESAVGGIESADGAEYTVGNDENGSAEGIGETDIGSEQGLKQPEMESLGNESSLSMQTAGRQRLLESGRYFVVLVGIWIVGIVVTGGCMAVGQLRFISYLHRARQEAVLNEIPHEWGVRLKEHRMHVYTVQGLPGPCMAGRGIYISPELCSRKDELLHVLAHEYSHAVQGDNCWAFLRCILCMVYWFHPFVWLAAYASKQDSELACDERAIGLLGEAERFAYGRTLLGLAFDGQSRQPYIGAVLMMNDSAGKVKERVSVIAETKKKNGVTVGIVILIAVLMCGCAFTGAVQPDAVMEMEEAQRKEEAAMRAEAEEIEQMENAAIASRFDEIEQEKVQEEQRMESMRAEAEEIERMEQEQIRKYLEELEAKAQVIETALEAKRQEAQSLHTSGAEGELRIEVETKEAALREELDEVNSLMQEIKEEWQQATAEEFGKLLYSMSDEALESAMPVYQSGIEVMMLEQTPEGLPRSFAFKVCTQNTGASEVWKLYLADRYDTGTIDLYAFDEEECKKQFRDKVGFVLNEDENKVLVTYEKDMTVGAIDISEYAEYTVGKVVWDGSVVGYSMDEDGTVRLSTCIGLKMAETGETLYRGLPIIDCPVEIGKFGDRKFTLGTPSVDENRVNTALK